jgi:hypothetical protein
MGWQRCFKARLNAYKRVTNAVALRMNGRMGRGVDHGRNREPLTFRRSTRCTANAARHHDEDWWLGRTLHGLIVEKDTMQPVCKPIADRWKSPRVEPWRARRRRSMACKAELSPAASP